MADALDWTPQVVTDPCPDCGKQRDSFACKMRHVVLDTGDAKAARD